MVVVEEVNLTLEIIFEKSLKISIFNIMKNCNNCRKELEVLLCDVPSKWREQIINVICIYMESQEFPCKDIITCISDEMGTLNPLCLTTTLQEWENLSWYDKMQLIINKLCSIIDSGNISVENTFSIHFLGTGSDIDPLQAELQLSGDSGQIPGVEIRPDGLYIPSQAITFDRGIEYSSPGNARLVAIEDGAGTHHLWNYDKSAFRAGITTGTQWNNFNIGIGSAAFGRNTLVSGDYSFAAGDTISINTTGIYSFGVGKNSTINQPYSGAFGFGHSIVVDSGTSGTEGASFAAGIGNQLKAGVGYGIGVYNIIGGNYSGGIGYDNETDALHSHLIGKGLKNLLLTNNQVDNHIIIGNFNNIVNPDDIDELGGDTYTEKVCFTVAGGYEEDDSPNPPIEHRSDALKVYKTGTVKFYGAIDQRTSTRGMIPARWLTINRPSSPEEGEMGFNTNLNQLEYWNGSTWIQF